MNKKLIPCVCMRDGKAINVVTGEDYGDCIRVVEFFASNGADEIAIINVSGKTKHKVDDFVDFIKKAALVVNIPIRASGGIETMEDIKKLLYAGASKISLNTAALNKPELIKEASDRFGKHKIAVSVDVESDVSNLFNVVKNGGHKNTDKDAMEWAKEVEALGAGEIILRSVDLDETNTGYDIKATNLIAQAVSIPVIAASSGATKEDILEVLHDTEVQGAIAGYIFNENFTVPDLKVYLKEKGVEMSAMESQMPFSAFKLNSDGLMPVVVQDVKTKNVLMMAYMNEEAYMKTLETGRMTYYSRSKKRLWIKGETSGHYQFVKSMEIDCDKDTILAIVSQVGAACHTGNPNCFFTNLAKKDFIEEEPSRMFSHLYDKLSDRKVNPKEGSYTNYLYEKGLDKILKKIGEEATEVVIAAKNQNNDELCYEIADFLYHMIVLMCEQGIQWQDIIRELSNRE